MMADFEAEAAVITDAKAKSSRGLLMMAKIMF